jgi:hypothetical protein
VNDMGPLTEFILWLKDGVLSAFGGVIGYLVDVANDANKEFRWITYAIFVLCIFCWSNTQRLAAVRHAWTRRRVDGGRHCGLPDPAGDARPGEQNHRGAEMMDEDELVWPALAITLAWVAAIFALAWLAVAHLAGG